MYKVHIRSDPIPGYDLWVLGFEIQLDVGYNPLWSDMLTVSVNGTERWSTGQSTGHLKYIQEAMLAPENGNKISEALFSYRDYNQPGQLAWMRIQGQCTQGMVQTRTGYLQVTQHSVFLLMAVVQRSKLCPRYFLKR